MSLATTLLHEVLGGMTYEEAARANGLTRTGVERRVKALVQRTIREEGIDGLNESRAVYVRNLRTHRTAIEGALKRMESGSGFVREATSRVLTDADIEAAVRRARQHTETPERDVAMVWILLATGLRPLEVARLCVDDYLHADGTIRVRSEVRAEVAANHRRRPLFFCSRSACSAIDEYMAARLTAGAEPSAQGGRRPTTHRGFFPQDALFLGAGGRPFLVESVPTQSGTQFLCREIHYAYRKIFRRIGFAGLSAMNIRYTVIDRLAQRGADESQIC